MAEPSRIAQALEYLGGLDAAVAPKLRAVSDAIDPVNVARRAGLNLPTGAQATEAAHFVGPGADIEGMVNDAREGNAAFGRGDLLGALGGYGSAAMAIPMMALPGTVAVVKKGVNAAADAAKALPMDAVSRMARAPELGFGKLPDVYHGTANDIREFSLSPPTRTTSSRAAQDGVWAGENPALADEFAQLAAGEQGSGQNIVRLMPRAERPAVIQLQGNERDFEISATLQDAWDNGFDAVRLKNYTTPSGKTGENVWVFRNPNQLRSPNAAFDPANKDSANLLASLLAAGVFGAGVAGSTDKELE
jgi:hypothetical protein